MQNGLAGLPLEHLGPGAILLLGADVLNAWLGWYLLRIGKRTHSLILGSCGKHVLTKSYTSLGVVAGLGLVMLTRWKPFDPLVAMAIAANILWSGGRLAWRPAVGLLDYSDPETGKQIREKLDKNDSRELGKPAKVVTHLESLDDHEDVHTTEHYSGRPDQPERAPIHGAQFRNC